MVEPLDGRACCTRRSRAPSRRSVRHRVTERLPERLTNRARAPGVGLDDLTEPQVSIRRPRVRLPRVAHLEAVAEDLRMDARDRRTVPPGKVTEGVVQVCKDVDHLWPRRQPYACRVCRPVARVVH